jgi:beta-glucanase (GH16 family)
MKVMGLAAALLASASVSALAETPAGDDRPTIGRLAPAPTRQPSYHLTRQHIFNATPDLNCIDGACRHAPNLRMEEPDALPASPPPNPAAVSRCIDGACIPPNGPFAGLSPNPGAPRTSPPLPDPLPNPSPSPRSPTLAPPPPVTAAFDPNDPAASGMVLTFDDEFNSLGASADGVANGTTWTNHLWYDPSQPPAGFMSVHDGVLDLAVSNGAGGWTAGSLETLNSAGQGWRQKYGYFEVRAQTAPGQGVCSTFFLYSADHASNGAAPGSEIDIMEQNGAAPTVDTTTLHRDTGGSGQDQQNAGTDGNPFTDVGVDLTRGFHAYGMLWDPNSSRITFYLDGRAVMTQPKFDTTDGAPAQLILGAYTGFWGGNPDGTTPSPTHMYVDYVRVWQFPSQMPTATLPDRVSPPFGQSADNGSVLRSGANTLTSR